MATTNDVTGDSLVTKTQTDAYRNGWDAIFKKPIVQEAQEVGVSPPQDLCFECCSTSVAHKMGCGSKSVYDAYITLRDSDKWKYFTDSMLKELDNKVRSEQTDRKFNGMFDEEKEND